MTVHVAWTWPAEPMLGISICQILYDKPWHVQSSLMLIQHRSRFQIQIRYMQDMFRIP
jgi:hypothetical protein